jgi:glutamine amidotransferase
VVVASEPWDDEPGWTEVGDRSVLEATAGGVDVRPLPASHLIAHGPAEERTITR